MNTQGGGIRWCGDFRMPWPSLYGPVRGRTLWAVESDALSSRIQASGAGRIFGAAVGARSESLSSFLIFINYLNGLFGASSGTLIASTEN